MSVNPEANRGERVWKRHMDSARDFFSTRKTGIFRIDFAVWADQENVSDRAAAQYTDRLVCLGELVKYRNGDEIHWKWIGRQAEEIEQEKPKSVKPKLSKEATDFFKRMEIKEKMKASSCKDEGCPPFTDPITQDGCQYCPIYIDANKEETNRG